MDKLLSFINEKTKNNIQQLPVFIKEGMGRVNKAFQEDPQQFNFLAQHPLYEPLTRNSPTRRGFRPEDVLMLHGGVQFTPGAGLSMYRGMGNTNAIRYPGGSYGPGKYFTDDYNLAKMYGNVSKQTIDPGKSLLIDSNKGLQELTLDALRHGHENITEYAKYLGYDTVFDKIAGTLIDLRGL